MKKLAVFLLFISLVFCICSLSACGNRENKPTSGGDDVFKVDGFSIDGNLGEWAEKVKENGVFIPVADGQSANIYAQKSQSGVFVSGIIKHKRFVKDSGETLVNSHFVFAFDDFYERYITFNGESFGVTQSAYLTQSDGKIHTTQFEVFVDKKLIDNFDGQTPFGFSVRMSGYPEDYFWGYGAEWHDDDCTEGKRIYTVESSGIMRSATGSTAVIDGLDTDEKWKSVPCITNAYCGYGEMTAKGFKDGDGIYMYLTAKHKEVNTHQYWCFNPNFEIRLGSSINDFSTLRIVRYSADRVLYSPIISQAVMLTEYDSDVGFYITKCELFVSYKSLGLEADSTVIAGLSFRADERDRNPWNAYFYNGKSTWDMNSLVISDDGWRAL